MNMDGSIENAPAVGWVRIFDEREAAVDHDCEAKDIKSKWGRFHGISASQHVQPIIFSCIYAVLLALQYSLFVLNHSLN